MRCGEAFAFAVPSSGNAFPWHRHGLLLLRLLSVAFPDPPALSPFCFLALFSLRHTPLSDTFLVYSFVPLSGLPAAPVGMETPQGQDLPVKFPLYPQGLAYMVGIH